MTATTEDAEGTAAAKATAEAIIQIANGQSVELGYIAGASMATAAVLTIQAIGSSNENRAKFLALAVASWDTAAKGISGKLDA